ncbi:MAG: DUF2293 domain-containing protein [Rhizobiaceae bacterium]
MSLSTKLQKEIAKALTALAPGIPYADAEAVRAHAASRHFRSYPPGISAWLSLVAHIRHHHTDYDAMLADGYDAASARHFVLNATNEVLTRWRATRFLDADETV